MRISVVKQFLPEDIANFFKKIDEFLNRETEIIVIGGAAASLAYGVTKTTTDIDLATEPSDDLNRAIKQAKEHLGIEVPISYVGLFEPPYNYETRLIKLEKPDLEKLCLYAPEQHDLALMKMVRGYENDIQAIIEMHASNPLDFNVLVERFMEEMTQVVGNIQTIKLNFLLMLENLFSEEDVETASEITKDWGLNN